MFHSPCCSSNDLSSVVVSDYPIPSHSVFPFCVDPRVDFNDISPSTHSCFFPPKLVLMNKISVTHIFNVLNFFMTWSQGTMYQQLYLCTWMWTRVTTQISFRRLISRVAPKPFPARPELVTWFNAVSCGIPYCLLTLTF